MKISGIEIKIGEFHKVRSHKHTGEMTLFCVGIQDGLYPYFMGLPMRKDVKPNSRPETLSAVVDYYMDMSIRRLPVEKQRDILFSKSHYIEVDREAFMKYKNYRSLFDLLFFRASIPEYREQFQ